MKCELLYASHPLQERGCFLVFLSGALVLGSSLRYHSPGFLRICLVSPDLKTDKNINDLKLIFDYVIIIDLIYAEGKHLKWKR